MALELTVMMFAALEGDSFSIAIEGVEHAVTLRDVDPLARHEHANQPAQGREPFRLLFELASDRDHPQGTYTFTHPAIGSHAVFVVPVGRENGNLLLEAVFS